MEQRRERPRGIDAGERHHRGSRPIVARQILADHGPEPAASALALWIEARARPSLRRSVAAAPGPGDCRVRSLFGAISRGTERLVFEGLVPEEEHERMRAPMQEGAFPFPVKYGYSAVGRVEIGPEPLCDRTVFCLHPHQNLFAAPIDALRLVPSGVPPERAVLAPFMETALNVVWDAGIAPGDRVSVVGAGLIGSLVAYLASRVPGTEVVLLDPNEKRLGRLAGWGCDLALPARAPGDRDVVVHASGHPEGLGLALDCAGVEARVVEASWFGARPVAVPLGGAFHSRRLSIVSSQVGRLPADRQARWTHARRLDTALRLLADPLLDRLFSGETAFSRLEEDYGAILADPDTLCHRIRYAD